MGIMSESSSWLSISIPSGELPPAQLPSVSPLGMTISMGTAFVLRDEVVQNHGRAPGVAPVLFVVAAAVAQIEDRELSFGLGVVLRRGVHVELARSFQWRGDIVPDMKRAVGHRLQFVEARRIAGNLDDAGVGSAA